MRLHTIWRRPRALAPTLLSACLALSLASSQAIRAQETDLRKASRDPIDVQRTGIDENEGVGALPQPDAGRPTPEAEAPPAPAPAPPTRTLKENLRETIEEGERVLRELPRRRQEILRSRIANLERQEKRKKRELQSIQETLASLRADFYRRLAALEQRSDMLPADVVKKRKKSLHDDFDLHVESFEEERVALEEDIASIRETVENLQAQSIASSLPAVPAKLQAPAPPGAAENALRIPELIDPFQVASVLPSLRGRAHAGRAWLWSFKAEAAFHRSDLPTAREYWQAAFDETSVPDELRSGLATNLALLAYRRGEFAVAYRFFAQRLEGKESEDLSPDEAYVLAVLLYLNGDVAGARHHLTLSADEDRKRLEDTVGTLTRI